MTGGRVGQHRRCSSIVRHRTAPRSHHRSVSGELLQTAERILLKLWVEQDFYVVEYDQVGADLGDDFFDQLLNMQGALTLREVEESPRELQIKVNVRRSHALRDHVQGSGLTRSLRGDYKDESVIAVSDLVDLPDDLIR